ncbi:MAG: hypothetical protein AAGH67_14445 [Cyanobacteria bacterium P01_H01_bin.162]
MSVSGILLGSCVGALQAAILKHKLFGLRIWQWILASIAAIYLGLLGGVIVWSTVIAVFPIAIRFSWLGSSIFGAMLGMSVGLGQVLVLVRRVRGLRRWWLANVVGRSLGWLAADEVRQLLSNQEEFLLANSFIETVTMALLYGGTIGLVYGGVTALALPSLTPRQRSTVDRSA